MTREALLSALEADGEINVLACAVTAWHALGVEAWVHKQREAGRTVKGYLCIEAHPVSGRLLSEADFPISTGAGLRVICLENGEGGGLAQKLARKARQYGYYRKRDISGRKLYYLKPVQPDYDLIPRIPGRKVVAVMLDEGLGSYTNTPAIWLRCAFQEAGWKEGLKAIYTLFLRNPAWKRALAKRGQLAQFVLLQKQNGHWAAQEQVAACYRSVLEHKALEGDFSHYEGAVVINTDVNAEMGNIRDDEDLRALELVCAWCRSHRIPVVLKPHPRERQLDRYRELGCLVDTKSNGIPQELIFAKLKEKPLCTVSMASTTLVSGRVFFGIPGIAANRLMDWSKVSVKKAFEEVNRLLGDFAAIPETEEELREKLSTLKNG